MKKFRLRAAAALASSSRCVACKASRCGRSSPALRPVAQQTRAGGPNAAGPMARLRSAAANRAASLRTTPAAPASAAKPVGRRQPARIVAMVDVLVRRHPGQGGHDQLGLRVARDLDDFSRQDHPALPRAAATGRGAGADRRRPVAGRSAIGVGLDDERAVLVAGGRDA